MHVILFSALYRVVLYITVLRPITFCLFLNSCLSLSHLFFLGVSISLSTCLLLSHTLTNTHMHTQSLGEVLRWNEDEAAKKGMDGFREGTVWPHIFKEVDSVGF